MLEYGMSKAEVLAQVYPDEAGFLLDMAEERNARWFREMTMAIHHDPNKNIARLRGQSSGAQTSKPMADEMNEEEIALAQEKGAMQLAAWAGNMDLMRRIQLYKRANQLMKVAKNG